MRDLVLARLIDRQFKASFPGGPSATDLSVVAYDRDVSLGQSNASWAAHGYDIVVSPYTYRYEKIDRNKTAATAEMRRYDWTTGQTYTELHSFSGTPLNLGSLPSSPFSDDELATLKNRALMVVYDKLRANRSKINGHAFMGELHQTIAMLRRPFSSIQTFLAHAIEKERKLLTVAQKVKSIKQRRDAYAKVIAGTNLEISFGVKPFVSDVRAIAESIADIGNRIPPRDKIVVRRATKWQDTAYVTEGPLDGGSPGYAIRGRFSVSTKAELRCQYVVFLRTEAQASFSGAKLLAANLGFSWENLAPAAWELTPWSWAIDYLSNIGDVISASTTDTSNVEHVIETISLVLERRAETTFVSPTGAGFGPGYTTSLGDYSSHSFVQLDSLASGSRQRLEGLPYPRLQFYNPVDLLPQRIFNLLSVAEQRRSNFRFHT